MNGGRSRSCRVFQTQGIPVASSTPRSTERLTSSGGLLASAPDPVPPANRCVTPLRVSTPGRCPRWTRFRRWLPRPVSVRPDASGRSVPAKDCLTGDEQGLTARPSPLFRMPVALKGLSSRCVRPPAADNSVDHHRVRCGHYSHKSAHGETPPRMIFEPRVFRRKAKQNCRLDSNRPEAGDREHGESDREHNSRD